MDIINGFFTVKRLLDLLESFPHSIVIKDTDGNFLWVNQEKAAHYGLKPEDMIGKTDFDFLPEEEALRCLLDDQKVLTGVRIIDRPEILSRPDKSKVYNTATKIPIFDDGKIVGIYISTRDVTQKTSEQKVSVDILGMAVHDVRSQLNAIAGISSMLNKGIYGQIEDPSVKQAIQELAEISISALKKGDEILRQFTSSGLIFDNEFDYDVHEDIFVPALQELQEQIAKKHVRIDVRLGAIPGKKVKVRVNKVLLRQVVQNIFSNALEYVEEYGTIAYGYEEIEGYRQFNIYNDGPGVPPEWLEKIFDDTFSSRGSTGRGLSICRTIMNAMGGRIWCENTESGHPNFIIILPMTK
jgi:PAS domain S-box-containing protein